MVEDTPTTVAGICARWWASEISAPHGLARRNKAQLRRADGPLAAIGVQAVHRLNAALTDAGFALKQDPDRLALIAVALAHVKAGRGPRAAQAFGQGDPAKLGSIRFNAIIRAQTPRLLWKPLLRALAVIDGQADAGALASDLFYWSDKTRTQWCFDYYGAPQAAPHTEETPT